MQRIFNHKKDSSRINDDLFKCEFPIHPRALAPWSIDLRSKDVPIFDQEQIGSCTANAGAGLWGFVEKKALTSGLINQPEEFGKDYQTISRLMLYFLARCLAGDPFTDGGAELRNITGVWARWGICPETDWPYDTSKIFESPPHQDYGMAWRHKVTKSYRISDGGHEEIKTSLIAGYPVIFGFRVFENISNQMTNATGIIQMPQGQQVGGHAIEIIGYDDARAWYIIRNSWGNSWGDNGYGYMPYNYVDDQQLCNDFWTIRL